MKRKRVTVCMVMIFVFMVMLSSCASQQAGNSNSHGNGIPPENTTAAVNEQTNKYVPGTVTTTLYKSEWLDLRYEIPYSLRPTEEELDLNRRYQEAQLEAGNTNCAELEIYNSDETQSVIITTDLYDGREFDALEKEFWAYIKETLAGYGLVYSYDTVSCGNYEIAGQLYAAYKTASTTYRPDGTVQHSRALRLYRIVNDRLVLFQLKGTDAQNEAVLKAFTRYDPQNAGAQNGAGTADPCANGHIWSEETCTSPMTCTICGNTLGNELGHTWKSATCTTPAVCTRCNQTFGDPYGHFWEAATCTKPTTCAECGETNGDTLEHDIFISKCRNCDYSDFSKIARDYPESFAYDLRTGEDYDVSNVNLSAEGVFTFTIRGNTYSLTLKQTNETVGNSGMILFDCYLDSSKLSTAYVEYNEKWNNPRLIWIDFDGGKLYIYAQ